MGEGAAVLVLESLEHAVERGADIYAEVRGYGLTADANHITQPAADGRGAVNAMRNAMTQAGVAHSEVDYVNAHATSTPLGDKLELQSIGKVFGSSSGEGGGEEGVASRMDSVLVSSTKGATGHLLGAAGAAEAAFTIMALHKGEVPPTLNLTTHEMPVAVGIELVGAAAREQDLKVALSNSFGFGGTNASLCFARYSADEEKENNSEE